MPGSHQSKDIYCSKLGYVWGWVGERGGCYWADLQELLQRKQLGGMVEHVQAGLDGLPGSRAPRLELCSLLNS